MEQKEKQILFNDLCSRLNYGVIVNVYNGKYREDKKLWAGLFDSNDLWEVKPYLRQLASMTDEEIVELYKIAYDTWYCDSLYYKNDEWITFKDSIRNNSLCFKNSIWLSDINKVIDWLNSRHFDYRGLIKKGLALEAPKNMYSTKTD